MSARTKKTATDSVPRLVVALSVLPAPVVDADGRPTGAVQFGSAGFSVWRKVAGRYRCVNQGVEHSPDGVFTQLETATERDERCYVVCPAAFDSLCLLGFWELVRTGRYVIWAPVTKNGAEGSGGEAKRRKRSHPIVFSDGTDVLGYSLDRRTYRWVGTRQFGEPLLNLTQDAEANATVIGHWITSLMQKWLDTGCGSWHDTTGAAAWSSYQRRPGPDLLTDHNKPLALKLEDAACHGGRACVWTTLPVGSPSEWEQWVSRPAHPDPARFLEGPAYRFDVSAMYPTLMRDELFPTRLIGVSTGWTVERLRDSLGCGLKIARVRIRTSQAEYPARRDRRPVYPTGEFVTTLAEPELAWALRENAVREVYEVARYESGRPFADWGKWIIGMRRRAKRYGPPAWALYVKALSVALSGRLAKRSGGWEDRPNRIARREWGEWSEYDFDSGKWQFWRSIGGHVQERLSAGPRVGTLGAAYAFLTSYGRCQMRRFRDIAGTRNTIAQHTDGLTVLPHGAERLLAALSKRPPQPGELRLEGKIRSAWFRSPNHWWGDGLWTVAGIADGWVLEDDSTAVDSVLVNPARSAGDPAHHAIRERLREIKLAEICKGETVGEDGWVVPPHFGRSDDPGGQVWCSDWGE